MKSPLFNVHTAKYIYIYIYQPINVHTQLYIYIYGITHDIQYGSCGIFEIYKAVRLLNNMISKWLFSLIK